MGSRVDGLDERLIRVRPLRSTLACSEEENAGSDDAGMDVEGDAIMEEDEDEAETATTAAAAAAKRIKAAAKGNGAGAPAATDGDDDLAAYNLDDYDKEESRGAGTSSWMPRYQIPGLTSASCSDGCFQQHQGTDLLRRHGR